MPLVFGRQHSDYSENEIDNAIRRAKGSFELEGMKVPNWVSGSVVHVLNGEIAEHTAVKFAIKTLLQEHVQSDVQTAQQNKLRIKDQELLQQIETAAVFHRYFSAGKVDGRFDIKHLRSIHKHLYQDVYPWAGKCRSVDMLHGEHMFCQALQIGDRLQEFAYRVGQDRFLKQPKLSRDNVIDMLTTYYMMLYQIHPFYHGSDMVARLVLDMLAQNAGYKMNFSKLSAAGWAAAGETCFTENQDMLRNTISVCLVKKYHSRASD